jgi:hypothetical protein
MATIEIAELHPDRAAHRIVVKVPDLIWILFRRRAERRLYVCLSRLPPHIIRDAGFDPDDIHVAAADPWSALDARHTMVR